MKKYLLIGILFLTACATDQRLLIENGSVKKPDWVESTKISWTEGDQVFFKSQYTIRNDERLNACFQLAKLESKETLLREIAEDLRGQIDNAQQGISENTELILSQVRSSEYSGKVIGMKFLEQYHERYVSSGVERSDCYVMAGIRKADYDQIKRQVLYKIVDADPDLKRVIKDRAIQFFNNDKPNNSDKERGTLPPKATPQAEKRVKAPVIVETSTNEADTTALSMQAEQ